MIKGITTGAYDIPGCDGRSSRVDLRTPPDVKPFKTTLDRGFLGCSVLSFFSAESRICFVWSLWAIEHATALVNFQPWVRQGTNTHQKLAPPDL